MFVLYVNAVVVPGAAQLAHDWKIIIITHSNFNIVVVVYSGVPIMGCY